MAAKMSVQGLIMSFSPYLRSAMVRFPLISRRGTMLKNLWTRASTRAAAHKNLARREMNQGEMEVKWILLQTVTTQLGYESLTPFELKG